MNKSPSLFSIYSFQLLTFIPAFLFCIAAISVFVLDYEFWLKYLPELAGKEDMKLYIQSNILTKKRFLFIKFILPILSMASALAAFLLMKYSNEILKLFYADIYSLNKGFVDVFKSLNRTELLLFISVLIIFISRYFFAFFYYELQYDEAWTFVHFSSKGIFVSALSPNNNHIFYTLISSSLYQMGMDAKYAIRLPALFSTTIGLIIFFVAVAKVFNKQIALTAFLLSAFSVSFYFFSVLGRGYGLLLLFTVINIFSLLSIFSVDEIKKGLYFRLFAFSAVLGMYSNTAFFYIFLSSFFVFLFLSGSGFKRKDFFRYIKYSLSAAFVILLLYFPMIIAGGIEILGTAATGNTETSGDKILYLNRLADWLLIGKGLDIFVFVTICTALLFLIATFKTGVALKTKTVLLFYWIFPFLIFLISGIEAPYRIWSWTPIFLFLIVAVLFYEYKINRYITAMIIFSLLVTNFYLSQNHYFMNWSAELDKEAKKVAEKILNSSEGPIQLYSFSKYDKPLIEYYAIVKSKDVNIYMPFRESKRYLPFDSKKFDAVLLDIDDYSPTEQDMAIINDAKYKLVYQNYRIKLYFRD